MSDFLSRFPGAFAWPLRSPVRLCLLAGFALGLGVLRWLPWTPPPGARRGVAYLLLGFAFLAACAVTWLFGIVRRTTLPPDGRPDGFAEEIDKDDAWHDLLQFLGAFLVAYLPLLGALVWAADRNGRPFRDDGFLALLGATALAGTAYFPMALLLLGFTGDWRAAFNLPLGVRSMGRLGGAYAAVVAVFLLAGGLAALLELGWVRRTPELSAPGWAARTATSLAELYLAAVAMRALGLLYVARGERLGWVARDET